MFFPAKDVIKGNPILGEKLEQLNSEFPPNLQTHRVVMVTILSLHKLPLQKTGNYKTFSALNKTYTSKNLCQDKMGANSKITGGRANLLPTDINFYEHNT